MSDDSKMTTMGRCFDSMLIRTPLSTVYTSPSTCSHADVLRPPLPTPHSHTH